MQTQQRFAMPRDLAKAIDEVDRALAADNNGVVLLLRSESYNAPVNFVNVPPKLYKVFKVAKIDSVLKACGGAANQGPAC
jgi:hypothetical protein